MDRFAQEILERAQHAHDPNDEDRARVRKKLARRVGAGVVLSATLAKSGALRLTLLKAITPLVVVGAVVGLYGWTHRSAPELGAKESPVSIATTAAPTSATHEETAPTAAALDTAPVATVAPPAHEHAVARSSAAPIAAGDLEAETRLLADARVALQRSDYAAALAKLDEHEKTFPAGALTEERIGTRVLALCGAGRTADARAIATKFLVRYPRSPMATRVRASCAGP